MVFSLPNNPKNLDPSCKMDLDFLGLFWNETRVARRQPSMPNGSLILMVMKIYKLSSHLHCQTEPFSKV